MMPSRDAGVPFRTGDVVSVDDNVVRVQLTNGVREIQRSQINTSLTIGDRVMVQGNAFVGRLRRRPVGKTFQV